MRFRKKRLRTPCFQENVDPFCRVLELPAAAQGAQQLLCTLAVLTETPGPRDPARREETRRAAEKKKRKGKEQTPAWPPFRGAAGSWPSSARATRPCRAAARPPPGLFRNRSCRAPGGFAVLIGGGGCLSGSSGGCLGLSRRFVAKKPFCSVMRRSTACNRGPNLGQLQGSPPQDGCAHASSPGSLPLRPHHPKQQKESRRRPFRSSLRSSPSNPIAAKDATAAFRLQDVHTYINRKLKEKNTYKQRCHREAS